MGWTPPAFAHIPLIHGPDGTKLSKRHGALGVEAYRDMGYLPEALRNYLLRLGWAHGDDEIIDDAQAVLWFDLDGVGRSPARFDRARLDSLNGHYLRQADHERLVGLVLPRIERKIGAPATPEAMARLRRGMTGLTLRARTLEDLAEGACLYARARPLPISDKAAAILSGPGRERLGAVRQRLTEASEWSAAALESLVRELAASEGLKLGDVAQPIRAALSGSTVSPPVFEVMAVLGREETLARIDDACCGLPRPVARTN
jgi:glutamyl-tRNA synthetase